MSPLFRVKKEKGKFYKVEREKMDECEHGNYVQFFDWKTVDGHETNIYGRLSELMFHFVFMTEY